MRPKPQISPEFEEYRDERWRREGARLVATVLEAEALANEQGVAVKRLREVLLSFGAAGRAYADELRGSANPAVPSVARTSFGTCTILPIASFSALTTSTSGPARTSWATLSSLPTFG